MVTKVTVARGLTAGYLTLKYLKEMDENYKKGDWAEAAKDTGWYALAMAPVVAPTFFFGTVAYPVTVGIGVGIVSTAIFLEATGLGEWEDAVDLLLDPPTPKEWIEVVGPAIRTEVIDPTVEYVTEELWQKQLVDPISDWVSRRERDLREAWEVTRPRAPSWL